MKKFLYLLFFTFVIIIKLSAQTSTDNPFNQTDEQNGVQSQQTNEVWEKKKSNSETIVVGGKKVKDASDGSAANAPIDGGILVLLGAGALYGRKRWKNSITKTF